MGSRKWAVTIILIKLVKSVRNHDFAAGVFWLNIQGYILDRLLTSAMSGNATGATQRYADGDPCYDTMGHYAGAIQHCIASHSAIAWVQKSGIADAITCEGSMRI